MLQPSTSAQLLVIHWNLFLGLELATDQLHATIMDQGFELVSIEHVNFDWIQDRDLYYACGVVHSIELLGERISSMRRVM